MESFLQMIDVSKTYYGDAGVIIKANDEVNFELKKGEVHALLGENGAGKSTLVRNLTRRPDSGTILFEGKEVFINSPIETRNLGIGIAFQDLSKSLVERHSITENFLSIITERTFSASKISARIKDTLLKYDLDDIDPSLKIWKLSGGEKQRVEILKAIINDPKVLILDEPTSMLTPIETTKLFRLTTKLKSEKRSVIIITHHLEEAIEYCDRISVMRQGKVVKVLDEKTVEEYRKDMDYGQQELANLMVGQEFLYKLDKGNVDRELQNELLKVTDLSTINDMGDEVVHEVSFNIKQSEILGLAGIAGNGQKELVEAILTLRKITSGDVTLRNKSFQGSKISEIRKRGIAYIPEDRNKALVSDMSIRENLILNVYRDQPKFLLNIDEIVAETDTLIAEYQIKAPSGSTSISSLSGGNRQKVVVARELSSVRDIKELVIFAENPTIGLDVGTTQFVRQKLIDMKNQGAGVLLVSSDLSEIL
ncbi:MAG: ATP-binding cassette domain-containing protein, partial [Candidatus Heimdallarchaeota archaeon]|nr:ATP-binding cassette domain-containing protein [Candidatus Heimdallarchaeota archaeon]